VPRTGPTYKVRGGGLATGCKKKERGQRVGGGRRTLMCVVEVPALSGAKVGNKRELQKHGGKPG